MRAYFAIAFATVFFALLYNSSTCIAQRVGYSAQNANTDFISFESGRQPSPTNVANKPQPNVNNNNQNSNWPALNNQQPANHNGNTNNNPTRDWVSPKNTQTSSTTLKPNSNGNWPALNQQSSTQNGNNNNNPTRDWVSPKHTQTSSPTLKPLTSISPWGGSKAPANDQNAGRVKDLVSFYETRDKQGESTPKPFSYASALSGNKSPTNNNGQTQGTSSITQPASLKPISGLDPAKPGSTIGVISTPAKPGATSPATPSPPMKQNPWSINTPSSHGVTRKPNSPGTPVNSRNTPTVVTRQPTVSAGAVTDSELRDLSEDLLRKDTNNAARLISVNLQGRTTSFSKNDEAPLPLLSVPQSVFDIPTVKAFIPLLDNYEQDSTVNEYVTPQEKAEENTFIDAVLSTAVMRRLMTFLRDKGIVTPDPRQQRDWLKQMWFGLYSRGGGKIGSSAFEHVFLSELKNGKVSGLHNWIYFFLEESANRANYLGYMKALDLNNKGKILKFHFNLRGVDKPVDTMFVGTSPELEMALYTLCFAARADAPCPLALGGRELSLVTFTFRYRSKNMIGSAYPEI